MGKFLGISALRFAFPEAQGNLMRDLASTAAAAKLPEDLLRGFIEGFGATIDPKEDGGSDASLVWAVNVRQTLGERHQARVSEAEQRVSRAASNDDFASELRAALACQDAPSGVTIEELEE